jgi:hypothetical protein
MRKLERTPEEIISEIKLRMIYDPSKTLVQNKTILNEQGNDFPTGMVAGAGAKPAFNGLKKGYDYIKNSRAANAASKLGNAGKVANTAGEVANVGNTSSLYGSPWVSTTTGSAAAEGGALAGGEATALATAEGGALAGGEATALATAEGATAVAAVEAGASTAAVGAGFLGLGISGLAATGIGVGVIAVGALVYWLATSGDSNDKVKKLFDYCTTNREKISKLPRGLSDGEIVALSDRVYDDIYGIGTNDKDLASVFQSLKTVPDFLALIDTFEKQRGNLYKWISGDMDSQSDWEYIYRPLRDLVNNTLTTVKDTVNPDDKKPVPGGTTPAPTVQIPPELKDTTGVQNFQNWLDKNHPGWHNKYGTLQGNVQHGFGTYGPRTTNMWNTYKNEYLGSSTNGEPSMSPITPNHEQGANNPQINNRPAQVNTGQFTSPKQGLQPMTNPTLNPAQQRVNQRTQNMTNSNKVNRITNRNT